MSFPPSDGITIRSMKPRSANRAASRWSSSWCVRAAAIRSTFCGRPSPRGDAAHDVMARPLRWQSSPPMPLAVVHSDEVLPSIPRYANGKSVGAVARDLDLTESAATESERRTLRRCLPRMREHQRLMSRSDGGGRRRSTAVTAPKGRPRIVEPATSDSYGIGGGGCVQAAGRGSMTGIARRNS